MSEAASEILRAGGNAFDAAVAAGFVSPVAEPTLTSLGGGGFLLARPAGGRAVLFDFFVDTPGRGLETGDLEPHLLPVVVHFPGSDQEFHVGWGSVAVPGNVRGLLHVHERLGRLPLAQVLAPAIALARDGIAVNARQAQFLALLRPISTLGPTGRALYERDGRYIEEGDRFRNPELASFLETLVREGDRVLYEGEIARAVAREMRRGDGLLTEADLAAYRVVERAPLRLDYRGFTLLTNPPPSTGGSLVGLTLSLLERDMARPPGFGSPEHLTRLVAAMCEVQRRRDAAVPQASGGTTHLSICDGEGNVASMTTSNGEGSGHYLPGTGIMLNNMMGEDDLHPEGFHASPPGLRVASMMAPSVLLRGGEVRLVLGSGGSKRIRTALSQLVSDVVDFGMDVHEAVHAPRVHWDGDTVQVEPGFPPESLDALRARWPVNEWDVLDVYFGGVHAVTPSGQGAGDPRRGGHAQRV